MASYEMIADNVIDQLIKLDNWTQPGLTGAEFLGLFTRCILCGLVMTSRVFERHAEVCLGAVVRDNAPTAITAAVIHDIIDLTDGDGNCPEVIDLTTNDDCPGVIDVTLDK